MMAAQKRDSQERSGKGRAGEPALAANGAEVEQDAQRYPQGPAQQLRPLDRADKAANGEREASKYRRPDGAPQVAAEPKAKQRGAEVGQDEIRIEAPELDTPVSKRQQKQQPVRRV